MLCVILFLFFHAPLFAADAPPSTIPQDLWKAYTDNGTIPVTYWYHDDSQPDMKIVSRDLLEYFIHRSANRLWHYNGEIDNFIFHALDHNKSSLQGKEVLVMGSEIPWYESILLTYGAKPVVIDHHPIVTLDTRVTYLTYDLFRQNPRTFDLILSIAHTNQVGLGRYGEPLDPDGDLKEMDQFKKMLNPGGKLLLAVPVGPDTVVWNAYRVYGWKRLKKLLRGWKPVTYYGFKRENLEENPGYLYQPALLLTPR